MFTGLMDKDGDHDGIMNISEFEEAVRLCLGFKFDGEFMGYINRRYAEYRDERINILSFLYDLYSIRRTQPKETAIGQFSDFPIFKRREDGKVMVDFVRMMQTKHITSEQLAADLIALCRSNRIKTSAIMLKVIHIMEDDIFNTPGANGSSRRDQADPDGKGPESPLARIFEVIDYINDLEKVPQVSGYLKSSGVDLSKSTNDQDKLLQMSGVPRGNVMDYTLVRYLNSYMKYNMRILLKELIEDMRRKTLDLKSYITECIDSQDIVNLGQFYEFLSRQKHGSGGIDQLFEALGVTRTTKLPLPKFQIKLEREITLLNVLDDVDEVKEVIYGQEGQKLDAVELGVSNIVDKINQGLKMQQKTFGQIFYGSGNVQTIDKSQLERILLSMGIRDTAEVQRLMSVCRNRKVANTFNLKTLRRLCDSRSLDGQGDGRNTEEQLNLTIQNLKKTINSMGVNFSALFTKVDTNSNNTLDQRELFFLLYQLDDTITQRESNMIYRRLDANNTGSIDRKEFERFFAVDPAFSSLSGTVERLRWATEIFQEINIKLMQNRRQLKDQLSNVTNSKFVAESSFRLMMQELDIKSFKDLQDQNKFIEAFLVEGGRDVDYNLLQACLNVYMPAENVNDNPQSVITRTLLSKFGQNPDRVVDFLDIDNNGSIHRAELFDGARKIVHNYERHDFETLFTVIAKTESAKEIPSDQFRDYLNKFIERERDLKKLKDTGVGSVKENFDVVREKIKRFYNMDSSIFYQDLLTFADGGQRQVKFSEFKKYLAFSNIQLSDNENSALGLAFKAVGSTLLNVDYVTSMIFFGKANLQTLNMAERSNLLNLFFSHIRSEMNLYKHSSYDIFQDMLAVASQASNDHKQAVGRVDFDHVVQSKRLGLNKDEIGELFHEIAGAQSSIDYKTFKLMLYGKEIDDVTSLMFKIDERVQSKGINITDHFYKYGQAEITFRDFAECLLDIDPNLKFDEIDLLFCKIDANSDCKVSFREFENMMIHHSILNEFKYHLTTYARKNAKDLLDILYMTGNTYDGLLKDEFIKLVREITEGNFTAEQTNKLFFALDKDKDGTISKTELSEILDLAQKQIYNIREFLTFRSGVAEYCERLKINLQTLFNKYADESKKITKAGINKMLVDTVKYTGANSALIQKVLDSNLSDTIDLKEFKTGMIGTEINADEIILTMRRIIAANQYNIEKLFNDFAASNRINLDYFEFTNVIKALGMRLTFYELERLFEVLSFGQKDHITKQEFISALSGQDLHNPDRPIITVIQDFKTKVNSNPGADTKLSTYVGAQNKISKDNFYQYSKSIAPELGQADIARIFAHLDSNNVGWLDYHELLNFCKQSYRQNTADYNQKLRMGLLDVKAYCTRSGYRFFAQMARDDSGQSSGLIKRETFVSKMKMILSDNPNMINFLANHYNANSSVMVNYKKMNDDIHSLDDSETASSNSAIKIAILKYKHKEQKTFKELFDQFSVQKQMDSTRLEQLLEKAGFSNMNKEFVKNYITTFNKKSGNYLTYFQFVSSFDVSDQRPEFALLLRNRIALWQELKKIVLDKYNQSLSQSFDNCRTTLAMVQEMERLPGVSSKHVELMQFAAIFEDAIVPEKLDKFGLRLVEEVLGMDVKQSLPPEKPITTDTHLLVPGTKLTFKKLKGIKSFVAFLQEDAKQLHKTDCLAIFKRYDKDNAGKLSHAVFMKMLYDDYEQDTDPKTNPSLQKMMDQVKEYCGDDKSNYDYIKLCSLLGEDVEKKESTTRFEVEKEYAQQTLPPSLTDAEHEKKITEGAKPSEPAVTKDLTLKQAIRRHYSLIPMTKDAIIKHLVPNDRFVNIDDFRKTINKDMKTVDPAELTNYIHELAGENKMIEMKTLRDSLFPDLVTGKDLKSVGFEEQIDQVFSDLDIEQKNAIDKVKMTLGCKSLGLNLSPAELEKLFNQFKHHDSMFMDRNGFSRMVKYEYCKDISKNRLVIDRLDHLIPLIDPHRKGKINEDQLRCLFAKLGAVPTPEEIKAILIVCDVENKEGASAKVSIQKLRELVSQSIITFDPRKEDLNNALVKIRSKLSTNLLEQYNGFKFMPSNYMSSFTEDLYLSSNACWPTSVLKPQLADSRSYYTNLEAPNSGEVRQQQRFSRYVKSSRNCLYFELELQKATGVPIPDDSIVGYDAIVGREIRICLFEEEKGLYCANCINLECSWKMEYEDRIYFDLNKVERENIVYIKLPDPEFYSKDKKYSLIFEFVNFVRKDNSHTTLAMSSGFARFQLADAVSDKSFALDIVGGSPIKEHGSAIAPEDVRTKRKGFIPKLVSLFEGKVKSQIHIKSRFLKLNPAKLSELEEELTLLPDMGVFHAPQLSIMSYFRQCQGEDAFTVSGTVAMMIKINSNLASEVYINTFCSLFCIPACATILSHFWNTNVVKGLPKVRYEEKMQMLRTIFRHLYSTLTSLNFRFERHHPTDQLYGDHQAMNERAALLKGALGIVWSRIEEAFPQKKPVAPKFIEKISTLEMPKFEERHSAFNIQELMDEDFDIQIA